MKIKLDIDCRGDIPLEGIEREIIRETAQEFKEEARGNVPKRSGELRRSIEILQISGESAKVGSRLVYAPIHEFGGTIRPKKGKVMRYRIGGRWVALRGVTIKESRYLRDAARTTQNKVSHIAKKVMKERGI